VERGMESKCPGILQSLEDFHLQRSRTPPQSNIQIAEY
jgi:hypothetical protein